jgi:hypothetical protein
LKTFDRFIGIDWSGAKKCFGGIQVAEFVRGARNPQLLSLSGEKFWNRAQIARYLTSLTDKRTLVGIDFAFSLPTPFPIANLESVRDLWAFVDDFCIASSGEIGDYYAAAVWLSPTSPFRPYFRYGDYCGDLFNGRRLRRTEQVSQPRGCSVYKLMYSQVGRGSFAGMRVLRSLSPRRGGEIAIWPFDDISACPVVIAEVYPSAFYPLAGHKRPNPGSKKQAEIANVVDTVLDHFKVTCGDERPKSQDEIDAYVTSAALAHLSNDITNFLIPARLQELVTREGWIFGVPFGTVQ